MKEIIYIQAGNYSNYIGSHFWNTQESYFTYKEGEEPIVNHDISFREGLSTQNEPTFCPRALIFDYKTNFGALGKYNELYSGVTENDPATAGGLWGGAVAEYGQGQIAKSEYQRRLDSGEYSGTGGEEEYKPFEPRCWSDYNRMFFLPRSIHSVSELPDWETSKGDWNNDRSLFEKYDTEYSLSEGALRQFVEESDNMQGFQLNFDNISFGGFSNAMLESLRDEFPKIPILAFPLLSDSSPMQLEFDDTSSIKAALRDAICLQSLNELATQIVPLQHPSLWQPGDWERLIDIQKSNLYHTSALLSAHIESATLPLRLKEQGCGLSSLCQRLNWLSTMRFSQLRGMAPFINKSDDPIYYKSLHDYSSLPSVASQVTAPEDLWRGAVANFGVTRGITAARLLDAEYLLRCPHLHDPYSTTISAPAYPLPSSYPRIFRPRSLGTRDTSASTNINAISLASARDNRNSSAFSQFPQRRATHTPTSSNQTSLLSSFTTSTSIVPTLRAYAALVDECVRRRVSTLDAAGFDLDALKELRETLLGVVDGYDDGADERKPGEELGEDEEGGNDNILE